MGTVQIVRLDELPDRNYYLRFAASDEATFYELLWLVQGLGHDVARWKARERAWWVAQRGIVSLMLISPPFAKALARATVHHYDLGGLGGGGWEWEAPPAGGGSSARRSQAQGNTQRQHRAQGRPGSTTGAKGSTGSASERSSGASGSVGSSSGAPGEVIGALAALHVMPDAPLCVIQAAYRALSRTAHPDAGGSDAAMKRLNLAYETARAWAAKRGATARAV